jgi:hypothetical protein
MCGCRQAPGQDEAAVVVKDGDEVVVTPAGDLQFTSSDHAALLRLFQYRNFSVAPSTLGPVEAC